jgi:group I intron endonuclease
LLRETERNKSAIYHAILKYGISEFSFEIIEHCEPSILIEREQYYNDLIYPEYNILKFAGNRQGFIHSEATKELQRNARLGTVLSERTKLMMSNSNPKSTPITVYSQDKYCYGNVYSH